MLHAKNLRQAKLHVSECATGLRQYDLSNHGWKVECTGKLELPLSCLHSRLCPVCGRNHAQDRARLPDQSSAISTSRAASSHPRTGLDSSSRHLWQLCRCLLLLHLRLKPPQQGRSFQKATEGSWASKLPHLSERVLKFLKSPWISLDQMR